MNREKVWKQFLETDENGKPVAESSRPFRVSRRSFLAALGYSTAAVAMMSCRVPEQKIVPFLDRPPEMTPGVANWYASNCSGCSAACGTLVKVRDGRPIKIEGNPDHPVSRGGLCTVAHSLVFGLFDSERLKSPYSNGSETNWQEVDREVKGRLDSLRTSGKVRFVSSTIVSPASKALIDDFLGSFQDAKHIVYEPVSTFAIRKAHERSHGTAVVPTYDFEKAKVIVGIEADFLGTWISPVQFTKAYSRSRDLKDGRKTMSKHIHLESRMSLTGANADERLTLSPAEQTQAVRLLLQSILEDEDPSAKPNALPENTGLSPQASSKLLALADELKGHKGESLVVAGSGNTDIQFAVNVINESLGNYGRTIDAASPFKQMSDDAEFNGLVQEMKGGEVDAILMLDVNPAYDAFNSTEFVDGLKKVPLKVSFGRTMNETSVLTDYVCPDNHPLESWGDAEAASGIFSVSQPVIAPLFGTRSYQQSILDWMGAGKAWHDELRAYWESNLFPKQQEYEKFDEFWDNCLHDGVFVPREGEPPEQPEFSREGLEKALTRLKPVEAEGFTLSLYQKPSLRDGRFANSPWLQEMPDPISKVTWDNYAVVSAATASSLDLEEGRVIALKKGDKTIEVPVLIQPGQADDTIAVAVGYGRTAAGGAGDGVGANAFPFVGISDGTFDYDIPGVSVEPTARKVTLAKTQVEESDHERPLINEFSLSEYAAGKVHLEKTDFEKLFDEHDYPRHKWGMAIDLNACTGCNACVLSCQAENNIPVVGKEEVAIQRDMHWIRIDRYFTESEDSAKTRFQPLPCMHCENASCEMVCPVLATVHSSEGLNMQVYNRCVGTRYCSNNCAYKVRRFNWFAYAHDDPTANLALNPDVTVRSRGVMEKCTFCVQRIEEKKINARNAGREVMDGEIKTACQQSCPADAIIFGDMKDLKSRLAVQKKSGRDYVLLEDLNTKPAVSYLAKINNSEETGEEH